MKITQPSFQKGEISPEMWGRIDTSAYATGLATARNAYIHNYGGVSNRNGTRFIGPCKEHTYAPKLIPFKFKTTDTYMLEFGNLYMRAIRDGGYVTETASAITGVTQADPAVVTQTAHGYSDGDEVYIVDVVGMTRLNGNRYIVANKATNTYELTSQVTGSNIDSAGFTAYSSGGTGAKIYEIVTPYSNTDVFELEYTQSADVMTITHRDYPMKELSRTGHTSWTLASIVWGPKVVEPVGMSVTVDTAGTETEYYRVTAIDKNTGEESQSALGASATITAITQADPGVVTATAHGFSDNDEFKFDNIVGMTELNGNRFYVASSTANTFELADEEGVSLDTSGLTAYVSGGIARLAFTRVTTSAVTVDNTVDWTAAADVSVYLVYRRQNGIYGFIGETELTTFKDDNIVPNTSITLPRFRNPFATDAQQPQAVGYFEQRRVFGGSTEAPDTSNYSQVGNYSNFNVSRPVQADDAITATLAANEVNNIRHFIPMNNLLVMTEGSEWLVKSGPDSIFGPATIQQKPQSSWGSSYVRPVVSGNTIVFVTADGASIRSFGYSFQIDGYTGTDLNTLAKHLLRGYEINDMCLVKHPESRINIIRSDGVLLFLTLDQAQEVVAWSTADTCGSYESCATLPLGGAIDNFGHDHVHSEDAVYLVVKRTVNGQTVRYVETMIQNFIFDVRESFFVDSGLTLDVPIEITAITSADPVMITSAAHGLSNDDEIDILDIEWTTTYDEFFNAVDPNYLNGGRYTIQDVTANTFTLRDADGNNIDGSAFDPYITGGHVREAVLTVSGLDHLEGETVVALADGNVINSFTVTDGAITFFRKFSQIHVGKRFITDIETLDFQVPNVNVQGRSKSIMAVTVKFYKSRGLWAGQDKDHLVEMKQRESEALDTPTQLLTGDKTIDIDNTWNQKGRVFLRQVDPLPLNILAITPEIDIGEDNV
jgi:hypothetical protein